MTSGRGPLRLWWAALVAFVLAALTGAMYRWGTVFSPPFGLRLGYVRHAHSHLMYMGWATPALMALLLGGLGDRGLGRSRSRVLHSLAWVALSGSLLAYFAFLWTGYDLVAVGPVRLPLGAIAAGLNVLVWYGFAAGALPKLAAALGPAEGRMWKLAFAYLLLSTAGAWGRGALPLLGLEGGPWAELTVHVFLDLFADGWLTLGVLALAHARARGTDPGWGNGTLPLAIGIPLMPLFTSAGATSGMAVRSAGQLGAVLVGIGVLWQAAYLWRRVAPPWRLPLGLLAVKGVVLVGVPLAGLVISRAVGLRILYVHTSLLGFFTLGAAAAARQRWSRRAAAPVGLLGAAVLAVLVSLVLLSGLWPWALSEHLSLGLALLAAPLPPLVVVWALVYQFVRNRLWAGDQRRGSGL